MTAPSFSSTLPTAGFQAAPAHDLTGVINASIDPVMKQLLERVLPSIKSDALSAGAYSGDRAMATLPGLAVREATSEAERIAAQLGYQNFNDTENRRLTAWQGDQDRLLQGYGAETDRNLGSADLMTSRMSQLPGLLDTIMRISTSQGDLLSAAGGAETGRDQAVINDALARDSSSTTRPFAGLDIASNLLSTLSNRYGTTDSTGSSTTVEKTGGLG